jgi:alpha-tubulin suppressor-like RCC1 family protein
VHAVTSHGALGALVALLIGLQWACEPCPTLPADDDTAPADDDDSEADDDDDSEADDDDTAPWDDPGVWRDLSAGLFDACGIRGDGVLACWGEDRGGQAATPAGDGFRMVVMGHEHGCALDVDGVITCWGCQGEDIGDQGQCDPPEGRFVYIDAGEGNNCALDDQGAMVCWGDNNWGQNDPPEGPFTTMSTYFGHTCGIYRDGHMECWGEGYFGQTEVPEGHVFTQVGVSDWTTYAIDDQSRFLCWGRKECEDADDDLWMDLSIYTTAVCGVTVEGVPDCFGYNVGDRTKEPEGLEATQVAAGHNFSCALTPAGEIVCWGCGECPDDPSNQPFDCGDFGQCTPPSLDSF